MVLALLVFMHLSLLGVHGYAKGKVAAYQKLLYGRQIIISRTILALDTILCRPMTTGRVGGLPWVISPQM